MFRHLLAILSGAVLLVGAAQAEMSVSARYLEARGNHIVWEIEVPSPPPAAIIVVQNIPPGTEIIDASHLLSFHDREKGEAKWLISAISAGMLHMEMTVSKPIRRKGEIHGAVMFLDKSQNTTASIFMRPARPVRKKLEGC